MSKSPPSASPTPTSSGSLRLLSRALRNPAEQGLFGSPVVLARTPTDGVRLLLTLFDGFRNDPHLSRRFFSESADYHDLHSIKLASDHIDDLADAVIPVVVVASRRWTAEEKNTRQGGANVESHLVSWGVALLAALQKANAFALRVYRMMTNAGPGGYYLHPDHSIAAFVTAKRGTTLSGFAEEATLYSEVIYIITRFMAIALQDGVKEGLIELSDLQALQRLVPGNDTIETLRVIWTSLRHRVAAGVVGMEHAIAAMDEVCPSPTRPLSGRRRQIDHDAVEELRIHCTNLRSTLNLVTAYSLDFISC